MNNISKLQPVCLLISLVIMGFMGFLWGKSYGERNERQNQLKKQEEIEDILAQEQRKKGEFNLILNEVCSKVATKSSVLDLYKCKVLKEDEWYFSDLEINDIKEELDIYEDIVLCDNNIAELTLAEVADCLNYENYDGYDDFDF